MLPPRSAWLRLNLLSAVWRHLLPAQTCSSYCSHNEMALPDRRRKQQKSPVLKSTSPLLLMVSTHMPTAIETTVVRTAVISARMKRVTAAPTSLVNRRMTCLAVRVLALSPGCMFDLTTLSRCPAGTLSIGAHFPIDQQGHKSFPPSGIWSSHDVPGQATYTCTKYDGGKNQEKRNKHVLTLFLLYDTARRANVLIVK